MRTGGDKIRVNRDILLLVLGLLLLALVAFYIGIDVASRLATHTITTTIIQTTTMTHTMATTAMVTHTTTSVATTIMRETIMIPIISTTTTRFLSASIGEPVVIDNWKVIVTRVREAVYVVIDEDYYVAKNNTKIVIITIRVENIGRDIISLSDIWEVILVTNTSKSYEENRYELEYVWEPDENIISKAVKVERFRYYKNLAPGTYIEGDLLFSIPQNENPVKLFYKIEISESQYFVVEVKLS